MHLSAIAGPPGLEPSCFCPPNLTMSYQLYKDVGVTRPEPLTGTQNFPRLRRARSLSFIAIATSRAFGGGVFPYR